MSHWLACTITLLRTLIVVGVALPVGGSLCLLLRQISGWQKRIAWTMLVAPLLAPHLVTGYGYANFSLSLVQYPVWNELLYGILLLVSVVPIGTIMLYFAPPSPVSAEALHCHRLLGRRPRRTSRRMDHLQLWLRGPIRRAIPAACLMFLVAFQEFELASLLGVTSWTVWLFDAQAAGLMLPESLRFAILPLCCELVILLPACALVWQSLRWPSRARQASLTDSAIAHRQGIWIYLATALLIFCLIPWTMVLRSALAGMPSLITDFTLTEDILVGCGFALASALAAYAICVRLLVGRGSPHIQVGPYLVGVLASLPGLLGSLLLGLSLLSLFQLPVLYLAYDTPLPWFVGLLLFLLPRAAILFLLLSVVRGGEGQHLVRLLLRSPHANQQHQARELCWQTGWAMHFWAVVLLCYWAYIDLTSAAILAPTGSVSAPARLYNLMHYGQSAVLSAMVVAAFGIPALLVGSLTLFRRPLLRWLV